MSGPPLSPTGPPLRPPEPEHLPTDNRPGGSSDGTSHRSRRAAELLPSRLGSIRVRLTVLYSVVMFGLSGFVLGGVYLAQSRSLDHEPISRDFNITRLQPVPGGAIADQRTVRVVIQGLEAEINDRALEELRQWSVTALGVLFVASLGVGWVVAGRVLRPIGRITEVAREIQLTDLSRRIGLDGPQDELRALAETFDAMIERLDTAFASQRRFIQDASHELRNPLAVMRTNLDVVLADPDASPEELRRVAEIVRKTSERMSATVADLLAFARDEPPGGQRGPVDLAGLAEEVGSEFATAAAARSVSVTAEVESESIVDGDRAALRQAVRNLVDNAVRVTSNGSSVRLRGGKAADWAWLSVSDEGPGIPEHQQSDVFRRFWRGVDDGRGSGLGLAIVCQVVDAHRGEIRLDSVEGEGASFTMWLPVRSTDDGGRSPAAN
jgi:signal transduction histidine kinase